MISMPASRRLRAMILAPRSWPSRPGLAMTMRIGRSTGLRGSMGRRVSHTARGPARPARVSSGDVPTVEEAMRSTVRKSADVVVREGRPAGRDCVPKDARRPRRAPRRRSTRPSEGAVARARQGQGDRRQGRVGDAASTPAAALAAPRVVVVGIGDGSAEDWRAAGAARPRAPSARRRQVGRPGPAAPTRAPRRSAPSSRASAPGAYRFDRFTTSRTSATAAGPAAGPLATLRGRPT